MLRKTTHRRGFTAIELLIVILIMALLGSMAIPAILPALQRSRVNTAAAYVNEAAAQAQQMAQERYAGNDNAHFGIYLGPDGSGTNIVAVTYGPPSTGHTIDAIAAVGTDGALSNLDTLGVGLSELSGDSQAVFVRELPATAIIYLGDTLIDANGSTSIGWAYQFRTGTLTRFVSGAVDSGMVEVGTIAKTWDNIYDIDGSGIPAKWRDTWDVASAVVAPTADSTASPGLSIRSPNDNYRVGLRIYAPGLFIREEF